MLIASFHDNVFTRQFALKLQASAEALGIKCRLFDRQDVPELPKAGGWKPAAILAVLRKYPQDDVLLIDPDTVLRGRPDILLDETDFDVAVHYDVDTLEPSGPVFVRRNARARRLVDSWELLSRSLPECTDMETLSQALQRAPKSLAVRRLPVTYAWVERIHREKRPLAVPVFLHFKTDGIDSTKIRIAR